jgi:hypothetical protein
MISAPHAFDVCAAVTMNSAWISTPSIGSAVRAEHAVVI